MLIKIFIFIFFKSKLIHQMTVICNICTWRGLHNMTLISWLVQSQQSEIRWKPTCNQEKSFVTRWFKATGHPEGGITHKWWSCSNYVTICLGVSEFIFQISEILTGLRLKVLILNFCVCRLPQICSFCWFISVNWRIITNRLHCQLDPVQFLPDSRQTPYIAIP